jgi:riboflavin synthase
MFTGIIETTGKIISRQQEGSNIHFTIASGISDELKTDQSVSHDGICLTVVKAASGAHTVTAIEETLERSNLKYRKVGDQMNLERSMLLNGRLDGHLVQGHVDEIVFCKNIEEKDGSWIITFKVSKERSHLLVSKGSVSINGVSLTVVRPKRKEFSVAIIPYTYDHTNFHHLRSGDAVNIEYDIIGKYVERAFLMRNNMVQ